MTFYEKFVSQFDNCTYGPGSGFDCTCAAEGMFLYRASQGRIIETACAVRRETGDVVGGTNLNEMEKVSKAHGITTGRVYQPVDFATIIRYVETGRYGAILQILYAPVVGTSHDAFHGNFRGNHALFLSRPGATAGTIRVGDPGASWWADWPVNLLRNGAGRLDFGNGETPGIGNCYAYVTPGDPVAQPHSGWGSDVALAIRLTFAAPPVRAAMLKAKHDPGTVIGYADLVASMRAIRHNYGSVVGVGDVQALLNWAAAH